MTAGATPYAYEAHARLSRVTLRNGAYADYLYDRGGRLTRLANYHSAFNDGQGPTRRLTTAFDCTYDANSNITDIVQDSNGAEVARSRCALRTEPSGATHRFAGWRGEVCSIPAKLHSAD